MQNFVQSYFKNTENDFEFKTTTSMRFFCEHSWPIYAGFLWFVLLSQFTDPAIVCHGNNPEIDTQMVDSFCFFESVMVPWIGHPQQGYFHNGSLLNDQPQAYHFNWIYLYIVPILLISIFLSHLPKMIWQHSACCKPLEESLAKLSKRSPWLSYRYYDRKMLDQILSKSSRIVGWKLATVLILMHVSALFALIIIALLFYLAFYPNYSILIYGYDVLRFYLADWGLATIDVHPSYKLFPLITKCTYFYFGQSGTLQQTDLICSIRFNFILEKLCLFTWFHVLVLAMLIFYDLVFILSLSFRRVRERYLQNVLSKQYDTFPVIHLSYPRTLLIILLPTNIGHLNTMNLLELFGERQPKLPKNTSNYHSKTLPIATVDLSLISNLLTTKNNLFTNGNDHHDHGFRFH